MKTEDLTKTLPKNHLMPTIRYGCIEYSDWCRAEARRINQDPMRKAFFTSRGTKKDLCCIAEEVGDTNGIPIL